MLDVDFLDFVRLRLFFFFFSEETLFGVFREKKRGRFLLGRFVFKI